MKLSEMNTKQMAKALCDLTKPIANICNDKAVVEALVVLQAVKDGKHEGTLADVIAQVVPVLLDTHYDDAAAILSALTGKTREEIDNQSAVQTVTDILTCMDADLSSFFMPSVPTGEKKSSQPCTSTERRPVWKRWHSFWRSVKKRLSAWRTSRRSNG